MTSIHLRFKKEGVDQELDNHNKKIEEMQKSAEHILKSMSKAHIYKANEKTFFKRIKTGVEGLDHLIEGGIPEKSLVLLTGSCGTGKSIMSMQFLIEGAMNGEPGVYVSLQENLEETINQMRFFGWPVDKLVSEKKLLIVEPELYNFDALLTTIEDAVDKVKAKRLVLDAISIIGMYFEHPFKIRKSLLELNSLLKKLNCTTVAVSEVSENSQELSPFGVEEFVADGVIILYYIRQGMTFVRAVAIRKMRGTNHSTKIHSIDIHRPGGIVVYPSREIGSHAR